MSPVSELWITEGAKREGSRHDSHPYEKSTFGAHEVSKLEAPPERSKTHRPTSQD